MMQCHVYRSSRKKNTYLFLPERDDFSKVPESLIRLLGDTEFSFSFELTAGRKLILAEASEVKRNIEENGFFLQLPLGDELRC